MIPPRGHLLHSIQETYDLASQVVKAHPRGARLALQGELGAGKTSFVKGIAQALGIPPEEVTSPTYTYLHLYPELAHFDLYRIRDAAHFQALGLEEFLYHTPWCCIEWSDRIPTLLPPDILLVEFLIAEEGQRQLLFHSSSHLPYTVV